MRNRMYGGVRGRKMKVGGKLLHFPPTRFLYRGTRDGAFVSLSMDEIGFEGLGEVLELAEGGVVVGL